MANGDLLKSYGGCCFADKVASLKALALKDVLRRTSDMRLRLYMGDVPLNETDTLAAAQFYYDGIDILAALLAEVSETSDSMSDLVSCSAEE